MIGDLAAWLHPEQWNVRAAVDILVLAVIVYQLLLLIKGTRAVQMLLGILSLGILYYLTGPENLLELPTVHRVLGAALFFIPFAVVILFQNHIRRVLASFGSNPLRGFGPAGERPDRIADEVVLAATSLASKRRGALIVFEGEQGLRSFMEIGIPIDAIVTYDLLTSIFHPGAPLHDGAVVISEGRIRAASCYLPLTSNPPLTKAFGSRHRAAIGITEETDALAVVVSEERGAISLVRGGVIQEDLDAGELQETLRAVLAPPRPLLSRVPWLSALLERWTAREPAQGLRGPLPESPAGDEAGSEPAAPAREAGGSGRPASSLGPGPVPSRRLEDGP